MSDHTLISAEEAQQILGGITNRGWSMYIGAQWVVDGETRTLTVGNNPVEIVRTVAKMKRQYALKKGMSWIPGMRQHSIPQAEIEVDYRLVPTDENGGKYETRRYVREVGAWREDTVRGRHE